MTWVAAAVAGSAIIGGAIQSDSARRAANTQADASGAAQSQLLKTGQEASKQYDPYSGLGQTGINYLSAALPNFSNAPSPYQSQANYTPMTNADLYGQLAPNYGFMLQQGQGANLSVANAAGGMIGGNALKGLQDYTQNFAGNAYQNALNNYMGQYQLGLNSNMSQQQQAFNQNTANQTNIYNRLSGIAGIGMQGATGAANALLGTGTNIAQLQQGIGQTQAAGIMGQGNAMAGAIQGVGNAAMYYGSQGGFGGGGLSAPGGYNQSGVQNINNMANPYFVGPRQ